MEVADRIRNAGAALTVSERRVAGVIVERPHLVGFGTVADLAAAAGTGAATVVRLATKLGYRGFSALQDSVQGDLANQLRPAAERIREHEGQAHDQAIEQVRATEVGNVNATLDAVDADELVAVVARLADLAVDVLVVAGDAVAGVAGQFVADLHSLRHGVVHLTGNDVARQRELAFASSATTVVAIDLRRYDRWVLDATRPRVGQGHARRGVDRQRALTARCARRPRLRAVRRLCRTVRQPSRHARAAQRAHRRGGRRAPTVGGGPARPGRAGLDRRRLAD
ncbi:MAG: hypothetical protein WKF58_13650 [Ilumatobacteraceae bacterium]